MSYLLAQIFICLLIAGLLGAIIGWFLRGGCTKKIRDCEDEWKMKIGSLESEWNSKLQHNHDNTAYEVDHHTLQAATLKKHAEHVETAKPSYSYEEELKKELERAQSHKVQAHVPTAALKVENSANEKPSYEQELKEKLGLLKEEIPSVSSHDSNVHVTNTQHQVPKINIPTFEDKFSHEQELREKSSLLKDSTPSVSSHDSNVHVTNTQHQVPKINIPAFEDKLSHEQELREKSGLLKDSMPSYNKEFSLTNIQNLLSDRGIKLSEKKIKLYEECGIDFAEGENLEDDYELHAIEGIGPKYAAALKEAGIHSTSELVSKLYKNHNQIDYVAKLLKVQPEALSSWVSMADLIQLPGVNGQAAELMQTVGISSARELGITNAHSLHSEMVAFNKKSPIVPVVPSLDALSLWSKVAKLLG